MGRKGIILAGGTGSRLFPMTRVTSKQLLMVYDKPMIYYPLSTFMLGGIREILIITTSNHLELFKTLLGDGSNYGIELQYQIQPQPEGLAQAFLLGEKFIQESPAALILGDNLFHGNDFVTQLLEANQTIKPTIFAYPVSDPERYGVVEFSNEGKVLSIEEKPKNPKSRYAITGLYFYDSSVVDKAKSLKPSDRGELEITDLNKAYLAEESLTVKLMGRGMAWLDTGTFDSLNDASSYIRTVQNRQGFKIGCIEEVAWRKGWIDDKKLLEHAHLSIKSGYGNYLINLLEDKKEQVF